MVFGSLFGTLTPRLSGLDISYAVGLKSAFDNEIILMSNFFFENFDFINECKNEF